MATKPEVLAGAQRPSFAFPSVKCSIYKQNQLEAVRDLRDS
jgi:hypothetical protein